MSRSASRRTSCRTLSVPVRRSWPRTFRRRKPARRCRPQRRLRSDQGAIEDRHSDRRIDPGRAHHTPLHTDRPRRIRRPHTRCRRLRNARGPPEYRRILPSTRWPWARGRQVHRSTHRDTARRSRRRRTAPGRSRRRKTRRAEFRSAPGSKPGASGPRGLRFERRQPVSRGAGVYQKCFPHDVPFEPGR